jgi:hypothetical protein
MAGTLGAGDARYSKDDTIRDDPRMIHNSVASFPAITPRYVFIEGLLDVLA